MRAGQDPTFSGWHKCLDVSQFWGMWGVPEPECCTHPPPKHLNAVIHPPTPAKGWPPAHPEAFASGSRWGLVRKCTPGRGSSRGLDTFAREEGGPEGGPHFHFSFFSFCTLSKSLKFQGPPTGSKNGCFPTAAGRAGPTNVMTIGLCPTVQICVAEVRLMMRREVHNVALSC